MHGFKDNPTFRLLLVARRRSSFTPRPAARVPCRWIQRTAEKAPGGCGCRWAGCASPHNPAADMVRRKEADCTDHPRGGKVTACRFFDAGDDAANARYRKAMGLAARPGREDVDEKS